METLFLAMDGENDQEKIEAAAEIIRSGGLVAIPTETVYGLGANALDEKAVSRIFSAKGRPQDNPLIIHIAGAEEIKRFCENVPEAAYKLAERFWPGPLTMVLQRKAIVPAIVTAGLDSVAVRCPDNAVTLAIIRAAGVPIAAPSANLSGRPSPTCAQHVFSDLNGKIEAIVDGGRCGVGVESTIVDLTGAPPRLLRPGGVTVSEIEEIIGKIEIDEAVFRPLGEGEPARAPGMKYRHYAPRAQVIILRGSLSAAASYANERTDEKTAVLCFKGEEGLFNAKTVLPYGRPDDERELAHNLFDSLRRLDNSGIAKIFARCPEGDGIALAVENRLMKAAGYHIVDV